MAIQQKLADDNPAVTEFQTVADSHNNIGFLQSQTGKPAEALESYRRALAIQQKLADDNPAVTDSEQPASATSARPAVEPASRPRQMILAALNIRQKLADDHPAVTEFQRWRTATTISADSRRTGRRPRPGVVPPGPDDPAEAGRRQPRRHRVSAAVWRIAFSISDIAN